MLNVKKTLKIKKKPKKKIKCFQASVIFLKLNNNFNYCNKLFFPLKGNVTWLHKKSNSKIIVLQFWKA